MEFLNHYIVLFGSQLTENVLSKPIHNYCDVRRVMNRRKKHDRASNHEQRGLYEINIPNILHDKAYL